VPLPTKRRNKAARKESSSGAPQAASRIARRERRRAHSRTEILEAARRVLLREGIAATTMDAVASEVGVTKTALYYYFASKDALLFELVFGIYEQHARAVHTAVEGASSGSDALGAIIRQTVQGFAGQLDDFRLAFLHNQVAGQAGVKMESDQLSRLRPLNDLVYAGTSQQLAKQRARPRVEPRLLAFLAHAAALGLLTFKGMVESVDDPLLYSDEQLVEGLIKVFAAAAR
jgi:AcrR family transcriptional regulator